MPVDPLLVEDWREHTYRSAYPMTHEAFLGEPAMVVDRALLMVDVERELKARAEARARPR